MDLGKATLGRSFNPKFTHYAVDGIGRDSYIKCNNGGLLPSHDFKTPQTGFNFRQSPTRLLINQPY